MRSLKLLVSLVVVMAALPLSAGNCRWEVAPGGIAFGGYSVFNTTALTATSTFTVRCNPNTSGSVTLSTGGSGTFTPRRAVSGGDSVDYNLFLDPAGVTIWGDNSGGSISYEIFNGTPGDKLFTDFIYGILPAAQDLAVGTYTDTVFATLSWNGGAGSRPPIAITVTMTVTPECRVDAFALDFGSYDPFAGAAVNQSTALKVYCTKNTAASVVLNNGSFPLGAQRRMMSPGGVFLNYDAALPSSSGTSTSCLVPVLGGFNVNGTVAALQDADVGAYTDTLVATVNY
jgi:spore coat protein U-like protein